MKKIIALTLSLAFMLTSFAFTTTVNAETTSNAIYVAVDGNDSNGGTVDAPLATIEGARNKIREIKKSTGLPAGGITVYVKNGTYRIKNQINFTEEDSGTKEAPIIYKAWGNGKTSLLGGLVLEGKDFVTISNGDTNYERLSDSAKPNVKVYDLKKAFPEEDLSGINIYNGKEYDPWSIGGRGGLGLGIPGIEVYYNDKAMDAARWPNRDANGKNVYTQFASLVSQPEGNGIYYKGAVYKYSDDRIENYATTKNASIVNVTGYWSERSSFAIDKEAKQVSIDHGAEFQFHWMKNTTYYYDHIFEELDQKGEYYFDYDTGKLYVYGDENIENASISVSLFGQKADEAILRLDKVSNITFSGFDIGLSRVNGIHVTSGTDVKITNCNIYGVGLIGIADGALYGSYSEPYLRGRGYGIYGYDCGKEVYKKNAGYNHNYINNHVYNTGVQGIVIRGGDRIDLDPANHNIINCEINNTGRFEPSFGGSVETLGVGINVIGNTIHDIPFAAIRFGTNDSVIEYNDIYNCMNEGNDMGVIYGAGWEASVCAGLEIRYNYIHDVDGTKSGSGLGGNGDHVGLDETVARRIGIYSDDGKPFLEMHHNIFENMPIGITSHGGAEHNINDNIFINVRKPIWMEGYGVDSIREGYNENGETGIWNGLGGAEYKALDNPAWRAKHPEVFEVRDELAKDPETAYVGMWDCTGNYSVFYTNPNDCNDQYIRDDKTGNAIPPRVTVENNTFTTSTAGFVDVANRDYSFTENSEIFATHPNLKSIDFKKIGRNKNVEFVFTNGSSSTSETLAPAKCNVTTKAIRLSFNEELADFSAKLFDAKNNEIDVTTSISATDATVKIDVPMALDSNYYLVYTATSASGTLEGCKKITCNKIWADDFEDYNRISDLSDYYSMTVDENSAVDGFELLERDGNTYVKLTADQKFLKPKQTVGVTATYEIDVLAENSTADNPVRPDFIIQTYPWAVYEQSTITANKWVDYQKLFAVNCRNTPVHGETFAFIRETTTTKNSPFYAAAFCNGNFLGDVNVAEFSGDNKDWNVFWIARWGASAPILLVDNMKIYTVSEEDVATTLELENISATRSEVTLDYSAEIPNGTFTLTQGGATVKASVSKTNGGKTVVITPEKELALDTIYTVNVTGVSDKYGRTINGYHKAFMLKTLFADNFDSYKTVSDMDSVWNVSYKEFATDCTVSGYNARVENDDVFGLENGCLVLYKSRGDNAAINIKSDDVSQWNKYTLEFDVKKDSGTNYWLDIYYHMYRENDRPNDFSNILRLGYWQGDIAEACFTDSQIKTPTPYNTFIKDSNHLKFTTKTGNDLQVFSDGVNVISQQYSEALKAGEIGFKVINGSRKQYIDNVVAYKLVEVTEIPVAPVLENISATKSEITLDYSTEIPVGKFELTQSGNPVVANVSVNGKTVVITPKEELALDTNYEVNVSNIPDYNGGTIEYTKAFMLKTLFADNFDSYNTVSDMDTVWNVSDRNLGATYTVSGFNTFAEKNVYGLDNGWLAIDGNVSNGAININSYDASEWNKYTLELDVKRDNGTPYGLDILYHMWRDNDRPNDSVHNFRLGLWQDGMAEAWWDGVNHEGTAFSIFTNDSYHLKLTTKTGNDLQVFSDGENVLSHTYNAPFGNGEIGFKATNNNYKAYIDNVVAYKLVELDNNQNNIFVKVANVTETGVTGTYTLAKYGEAPIDSADVIVAAYGKSNKLLETQVIKLDSVTSHNGDFSFNCNTPEDVVYVKACLWNSVDGMKPEALSDTKTIGYQTNK